MRRSRFTEEQILSVLHEGEAGKKVDDLCRERGIAKHTYYRWKAKYGGLQIDEAKRLRQLEDENRRLKQVVADVTLDNQALKGLLQPKVVTPAARREAVRMAGEDEGCQTSYPQPVAFPVESDEPSERSFQIPVDMGPVLS